jgi:hypothetical protein
MYIDLMAGSAVSDPYAFDLTGPAKPSAYAFDIDSNNKKGNKFNQNFEPPSKGKHIEEDIDDFMESRDDK